MKTPSLIAVACIAVLALSACGKSEGKKAATQIAARVNKEEISVHQVNAVLSRSGNIPAEQAKAAGRQILDKLIDQELLVQQAVDKKLDRDPKVMQALEAARREILARAYADQVMGAAAKPAAEDIKAYYAAHPELFSQRRVYSLQELAVRATPEQIEALKQELPRTKSLTDVANWLKSKGIQFVGNAGVKPAEQLPLELLPRYHAMKDGQVGLIAGPSGALVVYLVASQSAPMDEAAATPFIEQFLGNRKRAELADAEIKQLKAKAKIEYLNDFGPVADAGKPAEAPAAAPAAKPAAAPAKGPAVDGKSLDKGLSGLK